jgi:hypothetical protein
METTTFARDLLIGHWFAVHEIDDITGEQFCEEAFFEIDGSFEFIFSRLNAKGEVVESTTEFGDWGIVGNIHFTITKSESINNKMYSADLANAENYQAYQVNSLTSQKFTYQHITTGEKYTLSKVSNHVGHS